MSHKRKLETIIDASDLLRRTLFLNRGVELPSDKLPLVDLRKSLPVLCPPTDDHVALRLYSHPKGETDVILVLYDVVIKTKDPEEGPRILDVLVLRCLVDASRSMKSCTLESLRSLAKASSSKTTTISFSELLQVLIVLQDYAGGGGVFFLHVSGIGNSHGRG